MDSDFKGSKDLGSENSGNKNAFNSQVAKRPEILAGVALVAVILSYLALSSPDEEEIQTIASNDSTELALDVPDPEIKIETSKVEENQADDSFIPFREVEEVADAAMFEEVILTEAQKEEVLKSAVETAKESEKVAMISTPATSEIKKAEEKPTKITTKTISTETKVSATNTKKVEREDAKPRKAVKSWVFAKSSDQYTIQLIGSSNEKEIKKFIEKNKQQKNISYFHTIKDNKSWYAVVKGSYKSYSDAEKARKQLPQQLAKYGAWTRKYHSIQKEISANAEKIMLMNSSFAANE